MPTETRLHGFGVGSRKTSQQEVGPDGIPITDDNGLPKMMPVIELIFFEQKTGDTYILPLPPAGVEAVQNALNPSPLIVPQPGESPI
jgi:hypothetical protein